MPAPLSCLNRVPAPSVSRAGSHRPRKAGFALLITITLVAFLVLLLVSFAALTRVETQVASNSQQLSQARQNALLALNIAIGQLQKYAGPDQRTTARADMDAALINTTNANGRWTAVYGSRVSASYADKPNDIAQKITDAYTAAGTDALAAKGSQAILLNWLVSGNESTDFNPLVDVDSTDGHISRTTPPTISHQPGDVINLTNATSTPTDTDTSTLLVGSDAVIADSDRVTAPLVDIKVPEGSLPGFSSTSTTLRRVGRYAWWIGDENTKARLNLNIAATTGADQAFVTAQRAGVELMDAVHASSSVPAPASVTTTDLLGAKGYDPALPAVGDLIAPAQLPMLSSASAAALDTARKHRFHDLTTVSNSLLTDTYAGGLKKDLSAILANGASSPADSDYLFVPNDTTSPRSVYGMPTWGKLRSFAQTAVASGSALDPVLPSSTQVGLFPVMTFAQVGVEYFRSQPDTVRLAVFPYVVLWNPYTVPIKAHRYEFGITSNGGKYQLQGQVPPATTWTVRDEHSFSDALGTGGNYLRFVIDAEDIPAGESHIYTIPSPQTYQSTYDQAPTAELKKGLAHSYAIMPGITILADPTEIFRVAGNAQNHIPAGSAASSNPDATWRSNTSTYLGEISTQGASGIAWSPEGPNINKPWFTSRLYLSVSGSHPELNWLQESATGGSLLSTPGTAIWGLQASSAFGSRQRWIANNNPRAAIHLNLPFQVSRSDTVWLGQHIRTHEFDPSSDARASSATGLDVNGSTDVPDDNILFEFRPADQPLLSLGQLQQANLSVTINEPAYPIGNSQAPFVYLNSNLTDRNRLYRTATSGDANNNITGGLYDNSYLLNRALWDRYFVSTVPHPGTNAAGVTGLPDVLPNARYIRPDRGNVDEANDLQDADKAASRLLIAGGFNINSTSEQAWRAVLGGINQLSYDTAGTPDTNPEGAALSRFSRPPAALTDTSVISWGFTGYRRLDELQIAALARNIVDEVRQRGPFVSLGDFINRRLKDNPATTTVTVGTVKLNADETIKGALQNAIDGAPASGAASINNRRNVAPFDKGTSIDVGGSYDGDAWRGGPVNGSRNSQDAAFGSPSAFAAQFLTQADVLSAIGAGLSARSDTFTIRTYGESQNPLTSDITSRAWCEAVVQRMVEPLRRKSSNVSSADYNEPATATSTEADFGRRFKIISFRWLSPFDL